jgi:PAS domain S-box-containing protein
MNDAAQTMGGRRGGTSPARAARLIWLIVLLGLVTSAFTLVMVRAALAGIAAQRSRVAAAVNDLDALSTQIDRSYADAEDAMQRHLALQQRAGSDTLEFDAASRMLSALGASPGGAEAAQGMQAIAALLAGLQSLDGQCVAWSRQYRECQAALEERKREVDQSLFGLTSALGQAEGRQHLDLALKIRKFRKESGEAANSLARELVAGLSPGSDITDLRTEVSTLGALIERIAGEDELDRLADLKDNLLSASLLRLTPIIARFGATQPELQREVQASLAAFQRNVLGEGYKIDGEHQTISPGDGGLYTECRRRLVLRQGREALREKVARCGEQYKAASAQLDAVHTALNDRAGSETAGMFMRHWQTLLWVCVACAGGLVVLGNVIAGTIRRQIIAEERATAGLRQSEARTRTIVDTAMDAVVTMDGSGRTVGWNPQATAIFGYTSEEAIGRELAELIVPPARRGAHREGLRRFLETGEGKMINRRVEIVAMHRDGSEIPIELAISPLGSGEGLSFGAFLRDLTAQRRAETEREELHNRLLAASRQAGMAEVATGVLHNVGNVLNSVNVSTNVVTERLRHSEVASLQKAGAMLRENLADLPRYLTSDERGRHLPGFLIEVAQCLDEDQRAMLQELESVGRGLDHIKHIVGAQQTHAKRGDVRQRVRPAELIEAALEMNRESFTRHQIAISRDPTSANVPEVRLDKHRVLQVLINVISNAKNSLCEGRPSNRRISIGVAEAVADSGSVIRFVITDNGMGIAPENLARIFGHGFTTRNTGHGFGLHSAANAAKEMGGSLTAASDGPGHGATFTLELPASGTTSNNDMTIEPGKRVKTMESRT